mgnify:CR=1 FL=1
MPHKQPRKPLYTTRAGHCKTQTCVLKSTHLHHRTADAPEFGAKTGGLAACVACGDRQRCTCDRHAMVKTKRADRCGGGGGSSGCSGGGTKRQRCGDGSSSGSSNSRRRSMHAAASHCTPSHGRFSAEDLTQDCPICLYMLFEPVRLPCCGTLLWCVREVLQVRVACVCVCMRCLCCIYARACVL